MHRCLAVLILFVLSVPMAMAAEEKITVLIVDGQNNHDWRATTPVMVKALESAGIFTVDVATSPPRGVAAAEPRAEAGGWRGVPQCGQNFAAAAGTPPQETHGGIKGVAH